MKEVKIMEFLRPLVRRTVTKFREEEYKISSRPDQEVYIPVRDAILPVRVHAEN